MQHISILGCGWLGKPLASHFIELGFKVSGSTTSSDKMNMLDKLKINPVLIQLPHTFEPKLLESADYLIIDIPPQTRKEDPDFHKQCIESVLPYLPKQLKVIYISATSVYPDTDQVINEKCDLDTESERAKALIQVEKMLSDKLGDRLSILRFGGLLGYDRIPGSYSAGKMVTTGEEKVNYIHRDDAIAIIAEIIAQQKWGVLLNGVAPMHPTKKLVYQQNAEKFGFEPAIFEDENEQKKTRYISGEKLEELLDYTFIYPDPLHFYYTN